MTLTKAEIQKLKRAFLARDAAETIIRAARAKVGGKNKTHAIRKLLGLCPECGGNLSTGRFYCKACCDLMTTRHRRLYQKKHASTDRV